MGNIILFRKVQKRDGGRIMAKKGQDRRSKKIHVPGYLKSKNIVRYIF